MVHPSPNQMINIFGLLLFSTLSAASRIPHLSANIQNLSPDVLDYIVSYQPQNLTVLSHTSKTLRKQLNRQWSLSKELSESFNLPGLEFVPLSNDFKALCGVQFPDTVLGRLAGMYLLRSSVFTMTSRLQLVIFQELFSIYQSDRESVYRFLDIFDLDRADDQAFVVDFMNYLARTGRFDDALALKNRFETVIPSPFKYHASLVQSIRENPAIFFQLFTVPSIASVRVFLESEISFDDYLNDEPHVLRDWTLDLLAEDDFQIADKPYLIERLTSLLNILREQNLECEALNWAIKVHLVRESTYLHRPAFARVIVPILLKFGHVRALLANNIHGKIQQALVSIAVEFLSQKMIRNAKKYSKLYREILPDLYLRHAMANKDDISTFDQIIDGMRMSLDVERDATMIGISGSPEQILRVIQEVNTVEAQERMISALLISDRDDAIPIFKDIYPLLDKTIFKPEEFDYFRISAQQLFRLLQDPELVSTIKNSPIKVKISERELQTMLEDDKLFEEASKYPKFVISDFLGSIHSDSKVPEKVCIEMMRRFLKLKMPDEIPEALRFEFAILVRHWKDIADAELLAMGYLQLWQELHPRSLNTLVVDDGRDLSHIYLSLTKRFGGYFTEEREEMTRKLALLVDQLTRENIFGTISKAEFLAMYELVKAGIEKFINNSTFN